MENQPPTEEAKPSLLPVDAAIYIGFWSRCKALALDFLFIEILFWALLAAFLPIGTESQLWNWVDIGVLWLYFSLMEGSPWQATLGKLAVHIKVVDNHGHRTGLGRALWRNFLNRALPILAYAMALRQMQTSSGIPVDMLAFAVFFVGYMMVDWTARRQTLYDKLAGTFVVLKTTTQSNQPLPWYGRWVSNTARILNTPIPGTSMRKPNNSRWKNTALSFFILAVGLYFIMVIHAENDYARRAWVAEMLDRTDALKTEIVQQGCQPGSRPPPDQKITAIEVGSDQHGTCTITVTLGKFQGVATPLNGGKLTLTGDNAGNWVCSSSLPDNYLPEECRPLPGGG